MAIQGLFSYPGIISFESASVTISHGISPGAHQVTIAPQNTLLIRRHGTMTLTFGSVVVSLRDCMVDTASFRLGRTGRALNLTIYDRRWKWKYPTISGFYNLRDSKGEILKDSRQGGSKEAINNTEKTPQELATLCLREMKEERFNVTRLPNRTRPTVEWSDANAAQELAQICEDLGCRVVLDRDDRVVIHRLNEGQTLPIGPLMDSGASLDPQDIAEQINVVSAPIIHQADLKLEAVGLDNDGVVKKIDDLIYKPFTNGWDSIHPGFMLEAGVDKDLARETVFRWYRVQEKQGKLFNEEITALRQILPLVDHRVETTEQLGEKRHRPTIVWGIWFLNNDFDQDDNAGGAGINPSPPTNDKDATVVNRGFTLDTESGIIKFSEPIYRIDTDKKFKEAILRVRCGFHIRDRKTRAFMRNRRGFKTGIRIRTGTHVEKREDIQPWRANVVYSGPKDNQSEVVRQSDHYLREIVRRQRWSQPEFAVYAGLITNFNMDGAIQSVTWSIGPNGTTTSISRNQDTGSLNTVIYAEIREAEKNVTSGGKRPNRFSFRELFVISRESQ